MKRHEVLARLHQLLQPRTYLEVGVNDGRSLARARCRSIAIDPAFKVTSPIHCDVELAKATSDDFFARSNPTKHFRGKPTDFAFIDGMHLFEYAFRDFINIERHMRWTSVAVFDDMLPRSVDEAARDRHTGPWTGDVYKVMLVLAEYRPDLILLPLDTAPTGVLLVLAPDPSNQSLVKAYDKILAAQTGPDPQPVPSGVISRECAYDPAAVLDAPFWSSLVRARGRLGGLLGTKYDADQLRSDVESSLGPVRLEAAAAA